MTTRKPRLLEAMDTTTVRSLDGVKDTGERHEHLDDRDDEEVPITWIGNKTTPSHEPKGKKEASSNGALGPLPLGARKATAPQSLAPF